MSFPVYEGYKDSGAAWLGQVPSHWVVKPTKAVASYNDDVLDEATPTDYALEYVEISGVASERGIVETTSLAFGEAPSRARRRVQHGDVIISTVRTYLRAVAPVIDPPSNLVVSTGFAVVRARHVRHDYLGYVLRSEFFIAEVISRSVGVSYPAINASDMMRIAIPVPPIGEQAEIAAFLDRETAKINDLIEEQQRLIELLKEKRQAVISHAVTKGLDPNVPMKDSGIKWVGEVPEHWEVKQIRHFAKVVRGKFTHRPRNDPAFYDGDFPFIQTGDITGSSRYITEYKQTLNERGAAVSKEFPAGTLVMAIAANIGDVAILKFPAYFPDSIVGLIPSEGTSIDFLYFLMAAMKQSMLMTATISTQMNLNVDQIVSMIAACPPLADQHAIAEFLTEQIANFDALVAVAEHGIALLQERRSTLISAAVTGKIDVRNLALAKAEAA